MKLPQPKHKKTVIITLFVLLFFAAFATKLVLSSKTPSLPGNIATYSSDFGSVKSSTKKRYCSYAASTNPNYCTNIQLVEVTYSNFKSPTIANHDWREVSSPFDIYGRTQDGKLICAYRSGEVTTNQNNPKEGGKITFFVRPEGSSDLSCAKI